MCWKEGRKGGWWGGCAALLHCGLLVGKVGLGPGVSSLRSNRTVGMESWMRHSLCSNGKVPPSSSQGGPVVLMPSDEPRDRSFKFWALFIYRQRFNCNATILLEDPCMGPQNTSNELRQSPLQGSSQASEERASLKPREEKKLDSSD